MDRLLPTSITVRMMVGESMEGGMTIMTKKTIAERNTGEDSLDRTEGTEMKETSRGIIVPMDTTVGDSTINRVT